MNRCAHLWAVGFDDAGRAAVFRDELARVARDAHDLILLDVAVAVRCDDGSFSLNGESFPTETEIHAGTLARFLAALALGAPPLTGAAVGRMLTTAGVTSAETVISDAFVREVACLVKPGTSAVFVLDEVGTLDAVLRGIAGLGGTVLKTNVDIERATLIQSALTASGNLPPANGGQSS